MVPESTGNSSELPSGSFRIAFLSAMGSSSGGTQARHDALQLWRVVFAAANNDVPEIIVGQLEQGLELGVFRMAIEIAREHQVELEQAAAAHPFQPLALDPVHQTARFTSSSLMWLMAFVGLSPLGQTSTQFMMVWQRNSR